MISIRELALVRCNFRLKVHISQTELLYKTPDGARIEI